MHVLREWVQQVIRESRASFWESATRRATRALFAAWIKKMNAEDVSMFGARAGDFDGKFEGINYYVRTKFRKGDLIVDGGFSSPQNAIMIDIYVNFDRNTGELTPSRQEIYMALRSTLRHEIQHARQHYKRHKDKRWETGMQNYEAPTAQTVKDSTTWKKYLLNPTEIDAHVTQWYYEAKKARIPFSFIVNQKLASNSALTDDDKYEIREAYLDYAMQHFPKADLR